MALLQEIDLRRTRAAESNRAPTQDRMTLPSQAFATWTIDAVLAPLPTTRAHCSPDLISTHALSLQHLKISATARPAFAQLNRALEFAPRRAKQMLAKFPQRPASTRHP